MTTSPSGNGATPAVSSIPSNGRPPSGVDPGGRTEQLCTFEVVDLLVGIEVSRVQEVIRDQPLTFVALAPPDVRGLINLRGQIVTAVDLRSRLALSPRPEGVRAMNVVVRRGDEVVSLLVDRTRDVVTVTEDQFEKMPPTASTAIRKMCKGTYKLEGRLLMILDVDEVLRVVSDIETYKYPEWVAGLDVDGVLH